MSSEAICPLSVIPSRMAARMRSSVVIQKGAVERLVEFLVLAVDHLRRIETPHDFVGALGLGDAAHFAAEGVYLLDIMDRKVDIMADVAVLDAVGIDQRVVDVADMVVLFQQFVVLLAQQVAHPDQLFTTAEEELGIRVTDLQRIASSKVEPM